MHKYALSVVPLIMALAGCAVGPDYQEPETPLPERFVGADQVRPFDENAERRFWSGFDDPLLADMARAMRDDGAWGRSSMLSGTSPT